MCTQLFDPKVDYIKAPILSGNTDCSFFPHSLILPMHYEMYIFTSMLFYENNQFIKVHLMGKSLHIVDIEHISKSGASDGKNLFFNLRIHHCIPPSRKEVPHRFLCIFRTHYLLNPQWPSSKNLLPLFCCPRPLSVRSK